MSYSYIGFRRGLLKHDGNGVIGNGDDGTMSNIRAEEITPFVKAREIPILRILKNGKVIVVPLPKS